MMAGLNNNFVWRLNGEQIGGPSELSLFFIACTEVNAYLAMKYFLKRNDKFMDFQRKLAKGLINN